MRTDSAVSASPIPYFEILYFFYEVQFVFVGGGTFAITNNLGDVLSYSLVCVFASAHIPTLQQTTRQPFSEPIMMPDWKFLRTNGKKNSTGIMEMIIAARLIVMGDTRCIIVSGKPSVIVEL